MQRYNSSRSTRAIVIGLGGLLASAALVQILAWRAERTHRLIGKIVRLRDRAVHVVDHGEGPCVVLLHGNGAMVEDFASTGLIDSLAKHHRVLAFDRPGFGASNRDAGTWTPEREAEQLAEILELLGVKNPIVVAHSWATLVALSFALKDQSNVAGLVLLSGYYYPTTRLDAAVQTPASLPVIGPALRHTLWPLVARLISPLTVKLLFSPRPVPESFLGSYSVPMATRPSQLKSLADDTVGMPYAARRICACYSTLRLPVRLIAGVKDRIVTTSEQSERLNRELHDCRLQLLEGVGHMSHHARPDLVVAAVERLAANVRQGVPNAVNL